MPEMSTPSSASSSTWRCGKSSPITPTTDTCFVKYEAARAMNDAEPPSRSRWKPKGPSMSSSATEPTTSRERCALRWCISLGLLSFAVSASNSHGELTIDELIAAGRHADAARRALDTGEPARAADLYEKLWDFRAALGAARAAGDLPRAL